MIECFSPKRLDESIKVKVKGLIADWGFRNSVGAAVAQPAVLVALIALHCHFSALLIVQYILVHAVQC